MLLVCETIQNIPHIFHHFVLSLSFGKGINFGDGILIVFTKESYQGCNGRTTAHGLGHTVIEPVWFFSCVLDVLIFSLTGKRFRNVLEVKLRFALSEKLGLDFLKLHLSQRAKFHIIGTHHLDVVHKTEHSEQFVGRMGVGTSRLFLLKRTFSYTMTLALERTLEIQGTFKFLDLFVREFLLLTDGIELLHVLGFAVGIACTNPILSFFKNEPVFLIEMPEVITKVFAA